MRPKSLDYTEMCVLQIYRDWFGKKYNPEVAEEELIKQHESLQRIVYLFQIKDIYISIDDFGFCWLNGGPKSTEFEYGLTLLDKKEKAIIDFYEIDRDYVRENLFVYDNKKSRYEDILKIIKTSCPENFPLDKWIDIISCLNYLRNTQAIWDYKDLINQFVLRKYDEDKKIFKKAWEIKEELLNYKFAEYHKNDANNNV